MTAPDRIESRRIASDDLEGLARLYTEVFEAPPWKNWPLPATLARLTEILTSRGGPAEAFYAKSGYYVSDKMVVMGHWLRPGG